MTPHSTRRLFLGAAAFATASSATRGISKQPANPQSSVAMLFAANPFPNGPSSKTTTRRP